jgi:hypothetical protein
MLLLGSYDFVTGRQRNAWFFDGPSWPLEVENWEAQRTDLVHVWPRPWSMKLPRNDGTSE